MDQTCRDFDLDELTRYLAIRFYNMYVIYNKLHDKKWPNLRVAAAGWCLERQLSCGVGHGPAKTARNTLAIARAYT